MAESIGPLSSFTTAALLDVVRKAGDARIVDAGPLLEIASELRSRHLLSTENYVLKLAATARDIDVFPR